MRTRTLMRQLDRVEAALARLRRRPHPLLEQLRADPTRLLRGAGLVPDGWQERLLRAPAPRLLLLCARQTGKSTLAAALALQTALLQPGAPVLLVSPSLRQSGELFRKAVQLFGALGRPMGVVRETGDQLELANGSRILSLPGNEETVRGFSGVKLLVIDEAARVGDTLYGTVRPMLAVSEGQLVALSTPYGQRGWFHEAWSGEGEWERVRVTAPECPRIPEAFLREERQALGERWYRQEYLCSFEATLDAVFSYEAIQAALRDDIEPLVIE
jgi:hypothetical protein